MSSNSDLTDLSEQYKKQIDSLDDETLRMTIDDRGKALEYARKGIEQIEPEKLTDEYVEAVANEMQNIAKMILEERAA